MVATITTKIMKDQTTETTTIEIITTITIRTMIVETEETAIMRQTKKASTIEGISGEIAEETSIEETEVIGEVTGEVLEEEVAISTGENEMTTRTTRTTNQTTEEATTTV